MSGDLPSGAQIPSTQQLMDHYGGSNTSVQGAISALKNEGYLSSHVGKGVYVRDRKPFVVRAGAYFAPSPRGYGYKLLGVAEVHPPAEVAATFGAEARAILRHRLMAHNGDPVELSWSYYPAEIAAGTPLASRGKIVGGAPQVLADLGYPEVEFIDRLSARPPTTEELEGLDLPDDVPVIRQLRVIYAEGGRPVEVSILVKGAHLHELEYRETIGETMNG